MLLRINDVAPDFTAETTQGPISFHEWIGNSWAVLFSHPKDFTPVCTTELGAVAGLEKQLADRGAKVIGLSVDPVESHGKWARDIEDVSGHTVNYPMIGDPELKIAKLYGMLPADAGDSCEGRTPALNAPVRTVFVIGPDKRIKLTLAYPMTTGRNFDEIIRVLDSIGQWAASDVHPSQGHRSRPYSPSLDCAVTVPDEFEFRCKRLKILQHMQQCSVRAKIVQVIDNAAGCVALAQ